MWTATTFPDDPSFSLQNNLHNTGQGGGTVDADIDAPEAWDIVRGYAGTVVGVIDTGVDYNHPDLAPNIWTNPGEVAGNHIDDDGNGYIDDVHGWDFGDGDADPMDVVGHGTHVAGIIAAQGNNDRGVTGVAWTARIMPIKITAADGTISTAAARLGVAYSTMMRNRGVNIRVTNNSYTGETFDQAFSDAIAASRDAGMIFVAAAGNTDTSPEPNNDKVAVYPASYNLDNIISVAATTANDGLAAYSHFGLSTVDLGAPGDHILSTHLNGAYVYLSGASMAAPHVTGVVALAYSIYQPDSYIKLRDAILNGGDAVAALSGKTVTGRRLNAWGSLQLLNPPSLVVMGDPLGVAAADNILVRLDPGNTSYLQVLVNGVQTRRELYSSVATIWINGLAGADTITVDSAISRPVTISGGMGYDLINGGSGDDSIQGNGGSDTAYGNAGNDKVKGGGNNDSLYGSAGNDTLNGEDGADTMYGGIGDDYLISYGDFASDTLYGAAGTDRADVDSLLDVQPSNDVETWILH